MFRHAFVVECDETSILDTWTLLNSIYAYHGKELRVFVVGYGPVSHGVLSDHPLGNALTFLAGSTFEVSSAELIAEPTRISRQTTLSILAQIVGTACVLDPRSVLVSRFDDVFQRGDEGKIVVSHDGSEPEDANDLRDPDGLRNTPGLDGGFICLNLAKHWDLVALFDFASRFAKRSPDGGIPFGFPGDADHEIFRSVVQSQWKDVAFEFLPQDCCPPSLDVKSFRITRKDGPRLEIWNHASNCQQRFIHRRGLNTPGLGNQHQPGTLGFHLSVFDHFSSWPEPPASLRSSSQGHPIRVAKCDNSREKLVIGIITCPRPGIHYVDTVIQFREAGFTETIHVFCEPGVTTVELPNVVVHKNETCLGQVGNWRHCLEWLLENTSAEHLLVSEDDVAYCAGARSTLENGLDRIEQFGFLSLYTPCTEWQFHRQNQVEGWAELNRGWDAIGMQSVCLRRESAVPLIAYPLFAEVNQQGGPTDAVVAKFFLDRQVLCYYHFPSLSEHLGRISVHGHSDHMALNYDPEFGRSNVPA